MLDIVVHKQNLVNIIVKVTNDIDRFGVWCCAPLASNSEAFEFLASQTNIPADDIQIRIKNTLESIWIGQVKSEKFDYLIQVDWDPDAIDPSDEDAAQRATDLLAALSFLDAWRDKGDPSSLASCAEVLINYIDYLESFDLLPSMRLTPVDKEMEDQVQFLLDLQDGKIGVDDVAKFHEWLF
jgi:hypothetical protein